MCFLILSPILTISNGCICKISNFDFLNNPSGHSNTHPVCADGFRPFSLFTDVLDIVGLEIVSK